MNSRRKFWVLLISIWLVAIATVLLIGTVMWFDLSAEEREQATHLLARRATIAVAVLLAALGALAGLFKLWWRAYVAAPSAMAEQTRLLLGANPSLRLPADGDGALQSLARSINQLADERDALQQDVEAQIRHAKIALEGERNRLAALMADLPQSVVVCNLDGRILLYNKRARLQFKALAPGALIGLGRSIYAAFDRTLIAHALETLQARIEREGTQPIASFVTTTQAGQLIRVMVVPVVAASEAAARSIAGFVLTLENITHFVESDAKRDEAFYRLAEGGRASLARVRAVVEGLLGGRDVDEGVRRQSLQGLAEELRDLTARLERASNEYADSTQGRWPLEDMLAADLLRAAQRRIEAKLGIAVKADDVAAGLWVRVDSFSLMQAMTYLAARLMETCDLRVVRLRIAAAEEGVPAVNVVNLVHLDLLWSGTAISTETLHSWQHEPMSVANESSPLTLRQVVLRHGGEIRHGRDTAAQLAFFRLVLPAAQAQEHEPIEAGGVKFESRPEFYDFDLFSRRVGNGADSSVLDDQPLKTLSYTVFDTETSGLNPAAGDEIIQIGAVRIVNGRLLRHESFDQLVDPHRSLTPQSVEIHGITESMLRGQPYMASVLPRFHAFCADTVLVAHNAAFDMRFLQLKEEDTGVAFRQPLLDTLLLSAVIHPNQEAHSLEAIATRLGVNLIGRHTALGDAILTGEIFMKMIPLLLDNGISTLRQARAAAERTYYARLKY